MLCMLHAEKTICNLSLILLMIQNAPTPPRLQVVCKRENKRNLAIMITNLGRWNNTVISDNLFSILYHVMQLSILFSFVMQGHQASNCPCVFSYMHSCHSWQVVVTSQSRSVFLDASTIDCLCNVLFFSSLSPAKLVKGGPVWVIRMSRKNGMEI
jgi:hypothetical protein